MLADMNGSARLGSGDRRILAIGIELLPLLVIPLFLIAALFESAWMVTIGLPLIFLTGVGWALEGRWRAGIAVGLLRFVVLSLLCGAALAIFLSDFEMECRHNCGPTARDFVAIAVLISSFVVTTLASAGWLWSSTGPGAVEVKDRDTRLLAIEVELLPLIGLGLWTYLFFDKWGTPGQIGALAGVPGSGFGWILLGRRRIGLWVAIGRAAVVACSFGAVYLSVDRVDSTPAKSMVWIVCLVTALSSAAALAWVSQRSRLEAPH